MDNPREGGRTRKQLDARSRLVWVGRNGEDQGTQRTPQSHWTMWDTVFERGYSGVEHHLAESIGDWRIGCFADFGGGSRSKNGAEIESLHRTKCKRLTRKTGIHRLRLSEDLAKSNRREVRNFGRLGASKGMGTEKL